MHSHIQKRIALLLEAGDGTDRASRLVDGVLITLISLNVAAIILESVESIRLQHASTLEAFEYFSVAVFSLEYVLRTWSITCTSNPQFQHPFFGRLRYMFTFGALVDLIAILPFYLGFFFSLDLRFLRALRIIRILKISRYSETLSMILNVFKDEGQAFVAAFFLLFVLLILTSSGIYLIEGEVQPEAFGSIPAAMWWAMATLTTVGYGDVTPITPIGKLFGGCITIISIGTVALPAGILASGFTDQLRRNRETYNEEMAEALEDGFLTTHESDHLDEMREFLGLSEEDATLIYKASFRQHQEFEHLGLSADHPVCPQCHQLMKGNSPSDSSDIRIQ